MIKNLIFDFGMVLVDYDYYGFFRRNMPDPRRYGLFAAMFESERMEDRLDREAQPFDEIMRELIDRHPDCETEIRIFSTRYLSIVTNETAGMRELLTRLKSEGFRLYGLSNWCSKVYETIASYDIFKLLDGWVISSEEKLVKPEAAIYRRLFDKFGLRPEECLFADDKEKNILGGRAVGMDGIVFKDAAQYESELRRKLSGV